MCSNELRRTYLSALLFACALVAGSVRAQPESGEGSYQAVAAFHRPGFAFDTVNNETLSAEMFDGHVVLLDFWATWCAPCIREMPIFDALRAQFHARGFEVIGLAGDERDRVAGFLEQVPVAFPIAYGSIFAVMDLSAAYGNDAQVLPFSVLIDRDGNVRYTQKPGELHREDLERLILELL